MLGKQLSLLDEWSINWIKTATTTSGKTKVAFKDMAVDSVVSFLNLQTKGEEAIKQLGITFGLVTNDIPNMLKRKMGESVAEVTLKVVEFKNAGRDVVQGLINGMKEKID